MLPLVMPHGIIKSKPYEPATRVSARFGSDHSSFLGAIKGKAETRLNPGPANSSGETGAAKLEPA